MKNMIHVNPYVRNIILYHKCNIQCPFLGETLFPTIWKTYVIHVYSYEKHVSAPYVKHMGYFSWRHHMFLPYVKHVHGSHTFNLWCIFTCVKKAQHDKIENVAGSVWLSLFMDGTGKCKFSSTLVGTKWNRNTEGRRLGTDSSISFAVEF
jgi:hypothetical protein